MFIVCWSSAVEGGPGHGPVHLLIQSATDIGFRWDPEELAWDRPGLLLLSNLSGPFQHFRAAILGAWRDAVSAELCARKGFRGGPLFDIDGTLQLLNSDHVRERDKALLRSILVRGVWNGFSWKIQGQDVSCRFCGCRDHDGHLLWDCTFPPPVESVNILSFMILWRWIRLLGLGVFFGMVGYPFFLVLMAVPLALRPLLRELLIFLSVLLGGIHPVSFLSGGCLLILMLRVRLEGLLRNLMFGLMVVWLMAGCLALLLLGLGALRTGLVGFGVIGSGVIGMMMLVMVLLFLLVVVLCSVPGPLQTVQRAELWCVILALQANDGVHLGVDNLGVVRHVGRILDGRVSSRPCELLPDGDLFLLIERMLHFRGLNIVCISKVKGHADEAMVRAGAVRDLDRLGNKGADEAADFGRRGVPWWVTDAGRKFSGLLQVASYCPCLASFLYCYF